MKHGGDLITYEKLAGKELIDFSSNINPLGPPKGYYEYITDKLRELERYPDIYYREPIKQISNYLDAPHKNIILGNGAMEIIDLFISMSNRVIVIEPCFSEYKIRAFAQGKTVLELSYGDDFEFPLASVKKAISNGDVLIIGNPNNPTATTLDKTILLEIVKLARKNDALIVLDEAFYEFSDLEYDSIILFKEKAYENVAIIRAATKFFGLPGIRLGYGVCNLGLREELITKQLSWNINTIASLSTEFLFDKFDYITETKKLNKTERDYLLTELKKINKLKVYQSQSNFILFKLEADKDFLKELLNRGFLIRTCESFESLGKKYFRIAVKAHDDNTKLIKAIKEVLEK